MGPGFEKFGGSEIRTFDLHVHIYDLTSALDHSATVGRQILLFVVQKQAIKPHYNLHIFVPRYNQGNLQIMYR